jgi:hypothetical protein
MENFTALGTFWLPGTNAARAGRLVFDARESNTIVLRIAESFESDLATAHQLSQNHPIIFGGLETGHQVTLVNALQIGSSINIGQVTAIPATMLAHWIIVGDHFPDGIDTPFSDFQLEFDRLDEWALALRPGNVTIEEFKKGGAGRFQLEPSSETEFAAFGGSIAIQMNNVWSMGANYFRTERSSKLSYTPEQPINPVELVENVIAPLNQFIDFANGRPVHLSKISAHFPANDRQIEVGMLPNFVDIAFSGWRPSHDDDQGLERPTLALIAMQGKENQLLDQWMSLHERAQEAFGLMSTVTAGPALSLETKFLLAIQALEVMHRRILTGSALEQDELDRRIAAAASTTDDPKIRSWYESKLKYAGEKTLRGRLKEILQMIGEPGSMIASGFVSKAVTTRNFYTHYDSSSGQPEQGQGLYYLTLQILSVVDLFLLNQLGYTNEEATSVFSQSLRARELAYQRNLAAQQ